MVSILIPFGIALGMSQDGLQSPLSRELSVASFRTAGVVRQTGIILGMTVFISNDGRSITPGEVAFDSNGAPRKNLTADLASGGSVKMTVEAFDPITDVALLKPDRVPKNVLAARPAKEILSSVALGVLPTGQTRVQITRSYVTGVLDFSSRYVPLVEVRLESEPTSLAGSPIFSPDGTIVGMLLASLGGREAVLNDSSIGINGVTTLLGPRQASTAYALSPSILQRVADGFLKNRGFVRHPWIGLFFDGTPDGGAMVTSVVPGGPSALAGLIPGDLVIGGGTRKVISHYDLAAYLFGLQVGAVADLTIIRDGEMKPVKVAVSFDPRIQQSSLRRIKPL